MELLSLRESARRGPLTLYALRQLQEAGKLPGVLVGQRFRVDQEALLEMLAEQSAQVLRATEGMEK